MLLEDHSYSIQQIGVVAKCGETIERSREFKLSSVSSCYNLPSIVAFLRERSNNLQNLLGCNAK
jgi:hypothetical protein